MKRLSVGLIAAAAAVTITQAAFAADLPTKAPPVLPPPAFNWTGFYIGGYYGAALGSQKGSTPTATTGSHSGWTEVNQIGATLGLTAGYNWQFDPHWLVGVEGDVGYIGINRNQFEFNDSIQVGLKTDWYATARARFGYVTGPSLLYATAGAAFVHVRDEFGGELTIQGATLIRKQRRAGLRAAASRPWYLATGRPRRDISSSMVAAATTSSPTRTQLPTFPRRSTIIFTSSRPA